MERLQEQSNDFHEKIGLSPAEHNSDPTSILLLLETIPLNYITKSYIISKEIFEAITACIEDYESLRERIVEMEIERDGIG